jgi:uncharacterized protein (DUF2062 family)
LRRTGWTRLRGGELTPRRAAASIAAGVFIGCLPTFGLHLPLCLAVCLPLRLDAPVAYLAANISNPFVAPWLVVAEVQAGAWLLTGAFVSFDVQAARDVGAAGVLSFAALGAVVVGAALAPVAALVGAATVACWQRRRRG